MFLCAIYARIRDLFFFHGLVDIRQCLFPSGSGLSLDSCASFTIVGCSLPDGLNKCRVQDNPFHSAPANGVVTVDIAVAFMYRSFLCS